MAPKIAKKSGPGRPGRGPTVDKLIAFDARQAAYLEAIIATAEFGKPSFTSLVCQGADMLIRRALAKPDMRAAIEAHLRSHRGADLKVVRASGGNDAAAT